MRHSPNAYAEAFLEALKASPREEASLAKGLVRTAMKYGDGGTLKKILKAIEERLVKQSGGRMVDVEVARELSPELLTKIKNSFQDSDRVSVKVNPALVAGMRATIDEEWEVDASMSTKIKKLFR